uniref:Sushi domain-containing protein n=1 Tax=Gopherus evgoodei TaxID=1825980 RepID=A0A8C4VLC1_9SAUR
GLPPAPGVPSFSGVPTMGKMPGRFGRDLCLLCFPAVWLLLPATVFSSQFKPPRWGFPVNTQVTYKCRDGFLKIPGKSDTVVCLSNSQWSNINEFCGRSCDVPTRLKFAALNKEDEMKNYYPAGITVRYTCRPGYENITEMLLVSTCLDNLTWSEAPEFCRSEYLFLNLILFFFCLFVFLFYVLFRYKLIGRPFIHCVLKGDEVEWSELPACRAITCSSPPYIANGMYDGRGVENFAYNSTVTYRCDRGFQLIGAASIYCTTKDKTSGIWSGPAPKCKDVVSTISHCTLHFYSLFP